MLQADQQLHGVELGFQLIDPAVMLLREPHQELVEPPLRRLDLAY